MIGFILAKRLTIVIAHAITYATNVIYALIDLRFECQAEVKRVTDKDFYEVLGEACIGPVLFPCRAVGKTAVSTLSTAS